MTYFTYLSTRLVVVSAARVEEVKGLFKLRGSKEVVNASELASLADSNKRASIIGVDDEGAL